MLSLFTNDAEFTNPGQPATYTTRFTLAAADGTTVSPCYVKPAQLLTLQGEKKAGCAIY